MGTSRSPQEFEQKLNNLAAYMVPSTRDMLEQAGNIFKAEMRVQGARAAGPDRRLSRHRSRAVLAADFVIKRYKEAGYRGFANARGPWGIRDDSYARGRSRPHDITAKKAPALVFRDSRNGRIVRMKKPLKVKHQGSKRENYWEVGSSRAKVRIVRSLPQQYFDTVKYAFDNPFKVRKGAP